MVGLIYSEYFHQLTFSVNPKIRKQKSALPKKKKLTGSLRKCRTDHIYTACETYWVVQRYNGWDMWHAWGENRNVSRVSVGKAEENDHFEDLDIDGRLYKKGL